MTLMLKIILVVLVIISAFIIALIICFHVIKRLLNEDEHFEWVEDYKVLQISVSIVALLCAVFGAYQYWDNKALTQEREGKQEKTRNKEYVVDYYLDKSLDVFLRDFRNYVSDVFTDLNCVVSQPEAECAQNKYDQISRKYSAELWFPYALLDIDHPLFIVSNAVVGEIDNVFLNVSKGAVSKSDIELWINRLKLKAFFLIFNIREINTIIREKSVLEDYSSRNLFGVKNRADYKNVLARLEKFIVLNNNVLMGEIGGEEKLYEFLQQFKKDVDPSSLKYNQELKVNSAVLH